MPEGKIVKALAGYYYVLVDGELIQCRGRGNFRKRKITPLVGDEVMFQAENATDGYILEVFERKNELVRPPIANVDQAILVFSAKEPDFSPQLLNRFLVLVEEKHIEPIICISKVDLLSESERVEIERYADIYRQIGYEVVLTTTVDDATIRPLVERFVDGVTVFAGQSGVGKSSLLNAIRPDLDLKTDGISMSLGRGKHTTRHVELIQVGNGFVADTPGFSSLEFAEIEANELCDYFIEFARLAENCKFRGCTHVHEPKCAVKLALDEGDVQQFRYDHYLLFLQEIKDRKPRY